MPGNLTLCNCKPVEQQHRIAVHFLSRCRIEEKGTETGKVAKGKRTTHSKTSKASNCIDKHNSKSKYRQLRQTV